MKLSEDAPFVHPDCQITNSTFGRWCEGGAGVAGDELAL